MEEQAKKKFLMKVGIISLMVLIFVFWVLNIKNVFRSNAALDNGASATQWQNMKTDFSETVDKMSQSLDKIEATNERLKNASSSLINELIKETNKIASSTATNSEIVETNSPQEEASSTPVKNINCPPYINCMPTIGESRPCQIPAGCEGITQIAY